MAYESNDATVKLKSSTNTFVSSGGVLIDATVVRLIVTVWLSFFMFMTPPIQL